MNNRTKEIACWRIWNYLRRHGAATDREICGGVGITLRQFEAVIELLEGTCVEGGEGGYQLSGDEPPFTAVFPTLEEVDSE